MSDITILAVDLAKNSFQVCAANGNGEIIFNRSHSRKKFEQLLRKHRPCRVAMEACASAHFWGRLAGTLGH